MTLCIHLCFSHQEAGILFCLLWHNLNFEQFVNIQENLVFKFLSNSFISNLVRTCTPHRVDAKNQGAPERKDLYPQFSDWSYLLLCIFLLTQQQIYFSSKWFDSTRTQRSAIRHELEINEKSISCEHSLGVSPATPQMYALIQRKIHIFCGNTR